MNATIGRSDEQPNAMALATIRKVADIEREDGGFDQAWECVETGNVYRVRYKSAPVTPSRSVDKSGLAMATPGFRIEIKMVEIDPDTHAVCRYANGQVKLDEEWNLNITPQSMIAGGQASVSDIFEMALRRHIYDANIARAAMATGEAFLRDLGLDPLAGQPTAPRPIELTPALAFQAIDMPALPAPTQIEVEAAPHETAEN